MEDNSKRSFFNLDFGNVLDILIKLAILYVLFGWCSDILAPFMLILTWGGIIAIATYPAFTWMKKLFRGKAVLSSVVLTLAMMAILIVPSWLVIDSLVDGVSYLREQYQMGQNIVPPPGESTRHWPAFTKPLVDLWLETSVNTEKAIKDHSEQVRNAVVWVFGALSGFGQGLIQFIASIIVAGVLFVYSESLHQVSVTIFKKLAGERGSHFVEVCIVTIRNVMKGILGVAVIQAVMAGAGFFIAGVPFAGLWTILCLILAIVQVGAGPIVIPITIYMFTVSSTVSASILAIWMLIVLFSDNVLKPILLGRGAPAPMLVIFLGAIGGFISHGFIGLFLGAVILTLCYKLFDTWYNNVNDENQPGKDLPDVA